MGNDAKRDQELADSDFFIYLLDEENSARGLRDLLVAIEHRKPIVLVATGGEGVPQEFARYKGPKLLLRQLNEWAGRRLREFLVRNGLDPGEGPLDLMKRPF